jgi:ABC-type arginine transport system ATPase subunit
LSSSESSTWPLRIRKIKFAAGLRIGAEPLDLPDIGHVLILVGPNNSGKSLSLREIESWCFGEETPRRVVKDLDLDVSRDLKAALYFLQPLRTGPPRGQADVPGYFWIAYHSFRSGPSGPIQINESQLSNAVQSEDSRLLRQLLISRYTIRLDGRTRFSLVSPTQTGDLLQAPQNHLWALFVNDAARQKVRQLVKDAFELYFVIDPTAMQSFRIRLSEQAPQDVIEEQGLDARSRRFHSSAAPIEEFSDGVQAFVGLVAAILSLEHKILLVDEPEAFLFPPLARRLASHLAEMVTARQATLIVATHSSEFLMGCLEKTNASVVRLTYQRRTQAASARNLASSQLKDMMSDPLLRSSRVLDALFHEAVVVTEGDTDRALYDEVNRRLQAEGRGIRDALFVNAQNKQTEHKIVRPLRHIGIPAAAILDLDFLEDLGSNWTNLLTAALIPADKMSDLESRRQKVLEEFGESVAPGKVDRSKGISALQGEGRAGADSLLSELASYGVFLVPKGVLENWLAGLGVMGHRSEWLVGVFSKLGSDETSNSFVKAGSDDVWEFVDRIAMWANNVNRKGT